MNDYNLEEIWNKFDNKFDIKEQIDFFTLSLLLRFILEKEKLQSEIMGLHYSIIHQFIHWESINSDKYVYFTSIVNILMKLPKKYKCENIKNQIFKFIPKKYDFFQIYSTNERVKRQYKLKITNFSFFSYTEKIFFYTGKIIDKKTNQTITFISEKWLTINDVYNFNFQFVTINYKTKIFQEIMSDNISEKNREAVLLKNSLSNEDELFKLFSSKQWPIDYNSDRTVLIDVYCYITGQEKFLLYFLPFLLEPYLANISLKNNVISKIIDSHNNDYLLPIRKNFWEKELVWEKQMLENNSYFLELDKNTWEIYINFLKKSNYFSPENKDGKFLIYHTKGKKEYEQIESLFEKNNVNVDGRDKFRRIPENIINDWEWKSSNGGKIPKQIIYKIKGNGIVVLMGPAGHGKTFFLNEIIDFFTSQNFKIKLICPTWKAISLYDGKIPFSTVSKRNENQNDDFFDNVDLLIIDEISLIGKWDFLDCINEKTQIIFAGDINQLGPLESETKFKKYLWFFDINGKGREIDLTPLENYRISTSAPRHDGVKIQKNLIEEKFDWSHNVNNVHCFYWAEEVIVKLKELVGNNYTIITQFNGGIWGVDFLNRIFSDSSETFKNNDKIIFIETHEYRGINAEKPLYYKGLIGQIYNIEVLSNGFKKYIINKNNGEKIELTFHDDIVFDTIKHSYAINAHNAQGSTIENVVVLSKHIVGYDWLYTAVSRFSHNVEIIFITDKQPNVEFIQRKKVNILN